MDAPRVLVREEQAGKRTWLPAAPDFGWRLLGFVGAVLFISGLLDLAIAAYPLHFGSPDWEFGTIGSLLNALPVPMLGLALLAGAAAARGWTLGLRIWSIVALIAAVVILGVTLIWALNLPLAFQTVQDPLARLGLKKSVFKTIAQAVLYPIAFGWLGIVGLRHIRRSK